MYVSRRCLLPVPTVELPEQIPVGVGPIEYVWKVGMHYGVHPSVYFLRRGPAEGVCVKGKYVLR